MRMPVEAAKRIFNSALNEVLPPAMVQKHLKREGNKLIVGEMKHTLQNNVHIVGFGKAVSGMCRAVQELLGDHIVNGIISVPVGTSKILKNAGKSFLLPLNDGKITMNEGALNNLPDQSCYDCTRKIMSLLQGLHEDDIVITLVSGGGSALLCAPIPPLTLKDKLDVTSFLAKQGASIQELNTIRKSLSSVKGGKLARMAHPSRMVTLILSDIIGDPLHLIASGPTVHYDSNLEQTKKIAKKYNLLDNISNAVKTVLLDGIGEEQIVKTKLKVQNILVGTNAIAVDAAVKEAQNLGYTTFVLSRRIEGEARTVGIFMVELGYAIMNIVFSNSKFSCEDELYQILLKKIADEIGHEDWQWRCDIKQLSKDMYEFVNRSHEKSDKISIISAGETTVSVKGPGTGGRNQEMVLAAAIHQFKHPDKAHYNLGFLSAGTDGQDGPTDATGACFESSLNFIQNDGDLTKAESALRDNDSYDYLCSYRDCLIKPGLTGTNVMDLHLLMIDKTDI